MDALNTNAGWSINALPFVPQQFTRLDSSFLFGLDQGQIFVMCGKDGRTDEHEQWAVKSKIEYEGFSSFYQLTFFAMESTKFIAGFVAQGSLGSSDLPSVLRPFLAKWEKTCMATRRCCLFLQHCVKNIMVNFSPINSVGYYREQAKKEGNETFPLLKPTHSAIRDNLWCYALVWWLLLRST